MDVAELERKLDEIYDQSVEYHGFTDYMRDYEVIVYRAADPRVGVRSAQLRYLFRHCVEARCRTRVEPRVWRKSLDDRLIDDETGVDLDGYVWGVKWQPVYPGAKVIAESPSARSWAESIGIEFHEVRIEANAHDLTLVFSDLQVSELPEEVR